MENFLQTYRQAAEGDEAPLTYHLWCAVAVLSTIVSRRVWIDLGRFRLWPNLYIVLLGPPGNGKTSALSFAKDLLRKVDGGSKRVAFSAECQTKESLVHEWKEYERFIEYNGETIIYTPMSIFITELSHFLGPNSGHMIDFLTTVYDQKIYDTKTKNKGNDEIKGPHITLLACTTPQWITSYLKADIISGGFTRRTVFVNEDESGKLIPFPEYNPGQLAAQAKLLELGRYLLEVKGQFEWTPEARECYEHWYLTRDLPKDPSIRWYHKTKHVQMLKVAMLIAASELQPKLVLTATHITLALDLLATIEPNLLNVFRGMGRNQLAEVSQQVLDVLKQADGMLPLKKLEGIMWRSANGLEMLNVMQHLDKTGQVKVLDQKDGATVRRLVALPDWTPDQVKKSPSDSALPLLLRLPVDKSSSDTGPLTDL